MNKIAGVRMKTMTSPKFPLGQIVATPGALDALERSGQEAAIFIDQHASCNWGIVDEEDWASNDQALIEGSRILSAYVTLRGDKLWVITEADRSSTCVLTPDEY